MALFKTGAIVAAVSGKVGGNVFSHNRYGPYIRTWAMPTTVTSDEAVNAKGYLASVSQEWAAVTAANKLSWATWAQNNPITNRMGDQRVLSGHAAYVGLNVRLHQMSVASIAVPPIAAPPVGLATMSINCDIGAGDFEIVFTVTAVPADTQYWFYIAVVDSGGISYVDNLLRLTVRIDAAGTSPHDMTAEVEARFGTLLVGQYVHVRGQAISKVTGLVSGFLSASKIVSST